MCARLSDVGKVRGEGKPSLHSPTRPMRAEGLGHTKQGFSMAGVAGGENSQGCHDFGESGVGSRRV